MASTLLVHCNGAVGLIDWLHDQFGKLEPYCHDWQPCLSCNGFIAEASGAALGRGELVELDQPVLLSQPDGIVGQAHFALEGT